SLVEMSRLAGVSRYWNECSRSSLDPIDVDGVKGRFQVRKARDVGKIKADAEIILQVDLGSGLEVECKASLSVNILRDDRGVVVVWILRQDVQLRPSKPAFPADTKSNIRDDSSADIEVAVQVEQPHILIALGATVLAALVHSRPVHVVAVEASRPI